MKGFSFIELLLVLSLIVILSAISMLNLFSYRGYKNLEAGLNELVAIIKETQSKAISQFGGKNWSLRFNNPANKVEVFSGYSYQTDNVLKTYNLRTNLKFKEPADNFFYDLFFKAITGEVFFDKIISLNSEGAKDLVGDIIIRKTPALINTKIEKGLVGYWHFDEGTSTLIFDSTYFNNHGIFYNTPLWQTEENCKMGKCLKFDNTNRYILVNNSQSLQLDKDVTFLFWLKPLNCSSNRQGILFKSYNNEFEIILETDCKISFYQGDGAWEEIYEPSSFVVLTNNWNFVAIARNSQEKKIYFYLNGDLIGETTYNKNPVKSNLPVFIGKRDGSNYYLNGFLDELRIYNRVLTLNEIKEIYNLTK